MKVYIGPYRNWFGPYQLAEALCFWAKDEKDEYGFKDKPDWVFNFGTWLAENKDGSDSWITKVFQWIESKKKRRIKVHIDYYDVWGMDHTLALIVLPMLEKLKETQHGYPNVNPEDVPYNLQVTERNEWSSQLDLFDFPIAGDVSLDEERWNWVLDEMIFAFKSTNDDSWQDAYRSGEHDLRFEKSEDGLTTRMVKGPNDTYECDYEGMAKVEERIQNGFRLFGKYYQALWD